VSDSLRNRLHGGFAAALERKTPSDLSVHSIIRFTRRSGKYLVVGVIPGALAFLFIAAQVFPQMYRLEFVPPEIPYTVDSEFVRYADDGSSSIEMYSTSFNHNGSEVLLSSSIPGHPIVTAIRQTLDRVGFAVFEITTPFRTKTEQRERAATAARVERGCVDGRVIERGTIIGYPVVAVQHPLDQNRRLTMWMAPRLGCFVLRLTTEVRRPDGTFQLISGKQTLKINLTPEQ
jgi:hypothetical protein